MAAVDRTVSGLAYLDHASTTPIRPEAFAALTAELAQTGNASSLHSAGRRARRIVEESRESVAASLGVRPSDVVFTSGGTESDNLAIKGLYWSRVTEDPRQSTILISSIEHHAVLDAADWLARHEGALVVRFPVDRCGRVDPAVVQEHLDRHVGSIALVSVMWANNETGIVQPVAEIAVACATAGVPLHCDGVQAVAWLPSPGSWSSAPGALSVSGHKVGGPVGVGALVLTDVEVQPLLHGGGQELDIRSGTLMTAQIASMAVALRAATRQREVAAPAIARLRDDLIGRMAELVPDAVLTGGGSEPTLPGIAQFWFPGCEADTLLMLLDAAGIECSAGSACTAGVSQPSHVLLAMGLDPASARGALRFSLGWTSSLADIDVLMSALPEVVARARRSGDRQRARLHSSGTGVN